MKKFSIFLIVIGLLILTSCQMMIETFEYMPKEDEVGILTLWASKKTVKRDLFVIDTGHVFLSFQNKNNDHIKLGNYTLESKEIITFSLWLTKPNKSVWYNVESLLINEYSRYDDRIGISVSLNTEDVNRLGEYLLKQDDGWSIGNNNMSFCLGIWNKFVDSKYHLETFLPQQLYNIIEKYSHLTKDDLTISNSQIGYFENEKFIEVNE